MLLAAWPYPRLPDFNTEDIANAHDLAAARLTASGAPRAAPVQVVHVGRAWAMAAEEPGGHEFALYAGKLVLALHAHARTTRTHTRAS